MASQSLSLAVMTFTISLLLMAATSTTTGQPPRKKCLLFNLGDSNSDTGGRCAVFGVIKVMPPGRPFSCRASNDRLYIDYITESLGTGSLAPYADSLSSDFSNGANFAIGGMTAQVKDGICFPLPKQVDQFAYFRHQVIHEGRGPNISEDGFRNAIFSLDIGQNDLYISLGSSQEELVGNVTASLNSIQTAIKTLFDHGARKFMIYNTGPLGCLPSVLGTRKQGSGLDRVGCVAEANDLAKQFNDGLRLLTSNLQTELKGAIIRLVDMFAIKYKLIANASHYGFRNPLVSCLQPGSVCLDPTLAVFWDRIHYSDSANKIIADMIWAGDHVFPYSKFDDLCEITIS